MGNLYKWGSLERFYSFPYKLTSATAGEKAAIQMLPSFLTLHPYERSIALENIKEETLTAAFELVKLNLDPVVDVYEASFRYRGMTWCVEERIDDFFTKLDKEAKLSQHTTKQSV